MEYTVIDPEIFQNDAIALPDLAAGQLKAGEAFAVGAWEGKKLVGIAVLSILVSGGAELSWLYTAEEVRGRGVAGGLYAYAEQTAREIGVRAVGCSIFGDMETAARMYGVLKKSGFRPRVLNWHILEYDAAPILNRSWKGIPAGMVKSLRVLEQAQAIYLLRQDERLPLRLSLAALVKRADLKESLFYIEDGGLKACLLLGAGDEKKAEVLTLYMSPALKEKKISLAMLALMAYRMGRRPSGPEKVCFYVENKWYLDFYRAAFGPAERDCLVQRYEKKL